MNELSTSKNTKLPDNPSVSSIDKRLTQAQNELKSRTKATLLGRIVNFLLSSPRLHFLHLKLYSHFSNYQKEASEQGILRNRVSFFLEAKKAVDAQQKTEDAGTKVLTKNPLQNIVENQSPQPETVNIEIPPNSEDHQGAVHLQPLVDVLLKATNLDIQAQPEDVSAQPDILESQPEPSQADAQPQPDIAAVQPEPPQADVQAQPDIVPTQADVPKPSDSMTESVPPETPSIATIVAEPDRPPEERPLPPEYIAELNEAPKKYLESLDAKIKQADEEFHQAKKDFESITEQIDRAKNDLQYADTYLAKIINWGTTPDSSEKQTRIQSLERQKDEIFEIVMKKSDCLYAAKSEKENFEELEQRLFGGKGGYAKLPIVGPEYIGKKVPLLRGVSDGKLFFVVQVIRKSDRGNTFDRIYCYQRGNAWRCYEHLPTHWLELGIPLNKTLYHKDENTAIEELVTTGDTHILNPNGRLFTLQLCADEQYLAELAKNNAESIAKMEASSFDAAPGLKDIFGSKEQFDRLPLLPRKIDFSRDIESQITDKDMEKNAIIRFQDGKGRFGFAVRGKVKFEDKPEKIGIQAFYTDPNNPNRWMSGTGKMTRIGGSSIFDESWLKNKLIDNQGNVRSHHAFLKAILVEGKGSYQYSDGLNTVTLEPFTPLR